MTRDFSKRADILQLRFVVLLKQRAMMNLSEVGSKISDAANQITGLLMIFFKQVRISCSAQGQIDPEKSKIDD